MLNDKITAEELQKDDWLGEVVDNNDPENSFRCKIRVNRLYDELEIEDIPWAHPISNSTFSSTENGGFGNGSVPKIGTKVRVRFNSGDRYAPEYFAVQNVNQELSNELGDDYIDSHVLLYDQEQDLKIIYQPGNGIKIFLKDSHITINPDSSITIEHKDATSIIELEGSTCKVVTNSTIEMTSSDKIEMNSLECEVKGTQKTQLGPLGNFSAVGSEPLWTFLKALSTAVDAKWPQTPGVNVAAANAAERLSTSNNVKVTVP